MKPLYNTISSEIDIKNALVELTNVFQKNTLSFTKEDRNYYLLYLNEIIDKIIDEFKENYVKMRNEHISEGSSFVNLLSGEISWCLKFLISRKESNITSDSLIFYVMHSSIEFPDESNVKDFLKMVNYIVGISLDDTKLQPTIDTFIDMIHKNKNPMEVLNQVITEPKTATEVNKDILADLSSISLIPENFLIGIENTLEDIRMSWKEYKDLLYNHYLFDNASPYIKFSIEENKLFYLREVYHYELAKAICKSGQMITLVKIDNAVYILMDLKGSIANCVYGLRLLHNKYDARAIIQIEVDPNKKYDFLI